MVLTPDMLRGKNPVGEKVLSTCGSYYLCTNVIPKFDLKCMCLGKKSKTVPNACALYWKHPICIQKDMQYNQYAVQEGVLMGSSERNCSQISTWKRS